MRGTEEQAQVAYQKQETSTNSSSTRTATGRLQSKPAKYPFHVHKVTGK